MLDIKMIRDNPEMVRKALLRKGDTTGIDELLSIYGKRRELLARLENLRSQRNIASWKYGPAAHETGNINMLKNMKENIKALEAEVAGYDSRMHNIMLSIPNIPHESVINGASSNNNRIVKHFGNQREFSFNALPHYELGEYLRILDFKSAAKISGSNFPLYRGIGALLERALYTFMIDLHVKEHGYEEIVPPYMVKRECMVGTGQLPKMEGDMYRIEEDDLFLVPTAEVPLVNLHRGEILDEKILPINYVSYTPCFRREAGSYGKDTRGLIRVHQFDKVELVKITKPEDSYTELGKMLGHAEEVVKRLGLAYRVFELCAGELSFASSKTYDIEVWAPGIRQWLEVASISNCEDFQARRAGIRCKKKEGKGTFHPHTLNGSGVALARTYLAILETYQNADCTVTIPEVLVPYMGGLKLIK